MKHLVFKFRGANIQTTCRVSCGIINLLPKEFKVLINSNINILFYTLRTNCKHIVYNIL